MADTSQPRQFDKVLEYHFQWDIIPSVNHVGYIDYQPTRNPSTSFLTRLLIPQINIRLISITYLAVEQRMASRVRSYSQAIMNHPFDNSQSFDDTLAQDMVEYESDTQSSSKQISFSTSVLENVPTQAPNSFSEWGAASALTALSDTKD